MDKILQKGQRLRLEIISYPMEITQWRHATATALKSVGCIFKDQCNKKDIIITLQNHQ